MKNVRRDKKSARQISLLTVDKFEAAKHNNSFPISIFCYLRYFHIIWHNLNYFHHHFSFDEEKQTVQESIFILKGEIMKRY